MASKRATLQTKLAAAELKVAQKFDGVEVSYSHQGGEAATLWARPGNPEINAAMDNGMTIEGETREFIIPRQTGFSGGVSEGDEIAWGSDTYVVFAWAAAKWDSAYAVRAYKREHRRANLEG